MLRLSVLCLLMFSWLSTLGQLIDYPTGNEGLIRESNKPVIDLVGSGSTIYVPLKFHLIVDGNSWFNDTTYTDSVLATVNERFLGADIEFYECGGANIIQDAGLANGLDPASIMFNLHATHGLPNLINVYIPNSTTSFNGYSYSGPIGATDYNVQFNGLVFSGSEYLANDEVLPAHELGHYFGLYHTVSNSTNLELANGSNCDNAGDYCCDTPAEYSGMCCAVVPECVYNPLFGIVTDSNGDTLTADVTNIMSVMQYNVNCRDVFTQDQLNRVNYYQSTYLSHLDCGGLPTDIPHFIPSSRIAIGRFDVLGRPVEKNYRGIQLIKYDDGSVKLKLNLLW